MSSEPNVKAERKTQAQVNDLFVERWSPRAFVKEPMPREHIESIFEAARWSMSCFNDQPWVFVYATEGEARKRLLELLVEKNRAWAQEAPLVGVVFARKAFAKSGKPNRFGPFDTGAAWMALTLQARMLGYYTHGMGGYDAEASYDALGVPADEFESCAAFAVGRHGDPADLPEGASESVSDRKPLAEVAYEGRYKK